MLGGEQRDHAAGTGQAEALDDEVVVHPVPAGVVPRIMQRDVGERHVPPMVRVEQVSRQAGVGEALGTHLRLRIQGLRDRGRCRIKLDTDRLYTVRCEADEGAGTTAGLEPGESLDFLLGFGEGEQQRVAGGSQPVLVLKSAQRP